MLDGNGENGIWWVSNEAPVKSWKEETDDDVSVPGWDYECFNEDNTEEQKQMKAYALFLYLKELPRA